MTAKSQQTDEAGVLPFVVNYELGATTSQDILEYQQLNTRYVCGQMCDVMLDVSTTTKKTH